MYFLLLAPKMYLTIRNCARCRLQIGDPKQCDLWKDVLHFYSQYILNKQPFLFAEKQSYRV